MSRSSDHAGSNMKTADPSLYVGDIIPARFIPDLEKRPEPDAREAVKTEFDKTHTDAVAHPSHYTTGPVPGVECITVSQWFNFNLGNVIKYVWRAGRKGDQLQDLKKARQYLDFEIARLESCQTG